MKKRRLVLASVLKPVDDTRMYEKLGASLAKLPHTQVYIIGYPSSGSGKSIVDIIQQPLKRFKRLSLMRIVAPLVVLRKCIKVKPELLIVNTHELLFVAIVNRILFGTRILYDIRENYANTILNTPTFWFGFKPLLGAWVRFKEWLTTPFLHGFILAEKSYEKELRFIGNRYLILENKAVLPKGFTRVPSTTQLQLLFSGTLAESTGVFDAIELSKKLHQIDSRVTLNIIGHCPLPTTLSRIRISMEGCPYITLTGGEELVPHDQILQAIQSAHAGIISYPEAPHLNHKMPTKLYEYTACKLPILLINNPGWVEFCAQFPAAVVVDFHTPDSHSILNELSSSTFYVSNPGGVLWNSQEPLLHNWLSKIFI